MRLRSTVTVEARLVGAVATILLTTIACAPHDDGREFATTQGEGSPAIEQGGVPSRCYRSSYSVLLGPDVGQRNVGHAPGWIRLDSPGPGTNGPTQLIDANRAALNGRWERHGRDSLRVAVANDFLSTRLDVAMTEDSLHGHATAHSDADLERDAVGNFRDVRRAWELTAVRAPCDSMPRAWTGGDP
jgi:hypothetical protein